MKKAWSSMIACTLTATLIAGCSTAGNGSSQNQQTAQGDGKSSQSGGRVLNYWSPFSGDSQKWDQERIAAFEKKTGIKVNVTFVPNGGLNNGKLLAAITGNSAPDLVEADSPALAYSYAAQGSLESWDTHIDQLGLGQNLMPGFKDLMQYNGKTFLIPQDSNVLMLYYNTDMFKEAGLDPNKPPTTIEELDQYAEKLTKMNGNKIDRMGFIPWTDSGGDAFTWLWMFGSKIYDSSTGKLALTDDKSVAVYNWMNKYAQKYNPAQLKSFTSGFGGMFSPDHPFMTGKVAMTVTGNWFTNALRIYAPNVKYGVAKIPVPPGGRENGTLLNSNVFMIPKGSKNVDLAVEFVKFGLAPEINGPNFDQWRSIPVTDSKFDEVSWTKQGDPIYKLERELANSPNAGHPALTKISPQLSDELKALQDNVIYNNKDPKELLQALQDKLQKALQ